MAIFPSPGCQLKARQFAKWAMSTKEIKTTLVLINKRLDDINLHLADQSRKIDIDKTNNRIDSVREELGKRIDETNKRIDETNNRIDSVRDSLGGKIDSVKDELTKRIDRLYEVIVRRDEHSGLDRRVAKVEFELNDLKRMAA